LHDPSKRISVRLARRASIVLLAAQGLQIKDIAEQLGIGRVRFARWRERFLESGLQGIECDLPRRAPPVKVDVAQLAVLTT
jgi:transposase